MDSNPPTVAGMPSRIEDIFTPVWTTVVGGPAAEQDPGRWLFAAYTEVTDLTIETARKLQERSAPATSPLRRVESLGEHAGYTRYRTERSKYLFLVRNDGVGHLVACFATRPPGGFTEEMVFSHLTKLADFATGV
jgi:hypothetical protein